MLLCAVGAELATLAFHCTLPAVIITLTGSRLLLLFALWNPEAVKQIEEWCISTFSQSLNQDHFFCMVYRLHNSCWAECNLG